MNEDRRSGTCGADDKSVKTTIENKTTFCLLQDRTKDVGEEEMCDKDWNSRHEDKCESACANRRLLYEYIAALA